MIKSNYSYEWMTQSTRYIRVANAVDLFHERRPNVIRSMPGKSLKNKDAEIYSTIILGRN